MPMVPGEVVTGLRGAYRIEEQHGEGSFGITYKASDLSGGPPVILKELRIEKLDDWKALELFEREGEVLATLSHPNIPAFRDFFAHGGPTALPVSAMSTYDGPRRLSLVLVQELIVGVTLQQRVDLGQGLHPAEAHAILHALLGALHYLHERTPPLVHRDIKPGNVILTPDGRPYLVDFGAIQNRLTGATSAGSTIVGTVGFMPLEQIRGEARPASDLYALGVTLIVALAGRPLPDLPFDDAVGRIVLERTLPPGTPKALRDVLDWMAAPLLGQRAQSASDVLSRIDRMNRSEPEPRPHVPRRLQPERRAPRMEPPEPPTPPSRGEDPELAIFEKRLGWWNKIFGSRGAKEGGGIVEAFGGIVGFGGFLIGVVGVPLLLLVMFIIRPSVLEGAKDNFSKRFACPLSRIDAHVRTDLHSYDLVSQPTSTPPKDVAADPARLAVWNANQPKPAKDNGDDIIELSGCDHHMLWSCHRGKSLISCGNERELPASAPSARSSSSASTPSSSSVPTSSAAAPAVPDNLADLAVGPVAVTWGGHLTSSTGAAPPVGTRCTLTATVSSHGGQAQEERLTFECRGQMLYDSSVPLSGMSDSMFSLGEGLVAEQADAYQYFLGAKDIGTRAPPRAQVVLYTPRGELDAWRDTTQPFRVHAVIDKESSVRHGKAVRSDAAPLFDDIATRTARVTAKTGAPPFKTAACSLRIWPISLTTNKRNCRARLDCGGLLVYGAGTSGQNTCSVQGKQVTGFVDPSPTPTDGDPELRCDLDAETATLGDTTPAGATYSVTFALSKSADGTAR
jgi:serine/threonine protein kinase